MNSAIASAAEGRAGGAAIDGLNAIFEDPAWAEVYAACCCDTGEPASIEAARGFRDAIQAQNLAGNSERLVLRCMRIGATAISCLALQLKDRNYTRVDLSENQLGDHSVLSVRSLIRALPRLQWLALSGNLITSDGAKEIAEELEVNTSIESLVLGVRESAFHCRVFRANTVGVDGLRAMLEALQRNPGHSLTSLGLSNTALGPEAGKHLASFLKRDRTLVHLDLSSNPLSSEGICALLPACLQLRVLDMADTGCRGELIHSQLCAMLQRTTTLSHLSLANNPLETRALRRIARAVSSCECLVSLSLERTSMDTESVTVLASALLAAPVQSLTELDLSDNQLSQVEAITALSHAISRTVLQILRLNRNPVGDAGAREISDALDPETSSGTLQHLELASCRIGAAGATQIFICLTRNEHLKHLRLSDNFLDSSLDISLIEQLTHLQELHLSGNRLSHSALQRAAQACARNRKRARNEHPFALRAEVHRLLFQETKLAQARKRLAEDEAELSGRHVATERAQHDLAQLRASEAEHIKQLQRQIALEESALESRRNVLAETRNELERSVIRFEDLQQHLRSRLRSREQQLCEVQVQAEELDKDLQRQKVEHPQEVQNAKDHIAAAIGETKQLQESALEMRKQLQQLQERSLIDFRP